MKSFSKNREKLLGRFIVSGFFSSVLIVFNGFLGSIGLVVDGFFFVFTSFFSSVFRSFCRVFSSVSLVFRSFCLSVYSIFFGFSSSVDGIFLCIDSCIGRNSSGISCSSIASSRLNSRYVGGSVLVFVDNLHGCDTCEQDNGGEYNGFNDVVH